MKIVAVIQARMGSTRLPGKMLYPLDNEPVISHVIKRVKESSILDKIVLATTTQDSDDLLVTEAERADIDAHRGSESDVLRRTHDAAKSAEADVVVRVCADNPLISPACITESVNRLLDEDVDYAGYSIQERTLPLGVTAEAFTMNSFSVVESRSNQEHEREHVTVFYRENQSLFALSHIDVQDVFEDSQSLGGSDYRLTLDTVPDYELLRKVYENVSYNSRGIIDLRDAIEYIDKKGLSKINADIKQKEATEHE